MKKTNIFLTLVITMLGQAVFASSTANYWSNQYQNKKKWNEHNLGSATPSASDTSSTANYWGNQYQDKKKWNEHNLGATRKPSASDVHSGISKAASTVAIKKAKKSKAHSNTSGFHSRDGNTVDSGKHLEKSANNLSIAATASSIAADHAHAALNTASTDLEHHNANVAANTAVDAASNVAAATHDHHNAARSHALATSIHAAGCPCEGEIKDVAKTTLSGAVNTVFKIEGISNNLDKTGDAGMYDKSDQTAYIVSANGIENYTNIIEYSAALPVPTKPHVPFATLDYSEIYGPGKATFKAGGHRSTITLYGIPAASDNNITPPGTDRTSTVRGPRDIKDLAPTL